MSKLFSAAGTILPFALLLGGCGSESQDLSARDSQALSTLTQSAPAQGQVATSGKVVFSGRSSAASGSAVKVSATDARLVVHTCPATVRSDQTWSCTQRLADGGHTWTAEVAASGFAAAGIDFVVRSQGLAAPTIDQTPSPTRDSSPVVTGTASVYSGDGHSYQGNGEGGDKQQDGDKEDEDDDEDGGDHAPVSVTVSENGKALCTAANVSSRQWSCKVSVQLP